MLKFLAIAALAATVQAEDRLFELRTYTAVPGKLENVVARFRNHTVKLFEKHGMENIGYWVAKDTPDTLIYIVAHKNKAAADASWAAFRKDPEWAKVKAETEARGRIVEKVVSVYMGPVDFSKMK
jgi:hypothetical protein